jgi:hypothetical protein
MNCFVYRVCCSADYDEYLYTPTSASPLIVAGLLKCASFIRLIHSNFPLPEVLIEMLRTVRILCQQSVNLHIATTAVLLH